MMCNHLLLQVLHLHSQLSSSGYQFPFAAKFDFVKVDEVRGSRII
jgi:hypothetical protein